MPLYFHLLNDEEIDRLGIVLRILREERDSLLEKWHELYRLHLGEDRTFSDRDFKLFFGRELEEMTEAILARDIVAFSRRIRESGERLLARNVPFAEVVSSMHLFEESAAPFYRKRLTVLARGLDIPMIFDKLSHVRIIVLAEAYFEAYRSQQVLRIRAGEDDLQRLDPQAEQRQNFYGLTGGSPSMRRLFARIQAASATSASILITGESGTGKELVARAVHECSAEHKAPFIAVNCAALPRELIESELFGHRRGAFSGAVEESLGLVRAAHGGTLFLDEITEMPPETQAKLLRVLQDRRVRPVGGTKEVHVEVRFIGSTNRDPAKAVHEGRLREDLYYRLKVQNLHVPPLRERLEDVPLLVRHFIALFNERYRRQVQGIQPAALEVLRLHEWRGNVRELMNAIETAFIYSPNDRIRVDDLPAEVTRSESRPEVAHKAPEGDIPTFAESEKLLLERALEVTGGNKVRAAKLLGISRKQLYAKIRKYDLAVEPAVGS